MTIRKRELRISELIHYNECDVPSSTYLAMPLCGISHIELGERIGTFTN